MSLPRSLRRLLYLACSLVLFFLALPPAQAGGGGLGNGCPTPGDGIIYYSDSSHTEEVGSCWSDCCNCTTCTCSGQITQFAVPVPVNWLWCD
ncbi:MAG TPA: hypothetical protein VMW27_25655 [Thermoanaerobaculia bacterium]|nr:hypothetical protein [Thermoanaerobaculia bacterium]